MNTLPPPPPSINTLHALTEGLRESIAKNLDTCKGREKLIINRKKADAIIKNSSFISIARLMDDALYDAGELVGAKKPIVGWELEFKMSIPPNPNPHDKKYAHGIYRKVLNELKKSHVYNDLFNVEYIGTPTRSPETLICEISSNKKPLLEAIAFYFTARTELDKAVTKVLGKNKYPRRYTNHLHFSWEIDGRTVGPFDDTFKEVGNGVLKLMWDCLPVLIWAEQLRGENDTMMRFFSVAYEDKYHVLNQSGNHHELRRTLPGVDKQTHYPFDPFIAANAVLMAGIRHGLETNSSTLREQAASIPICYIDKNNPNAYRDALSRMYHSSLARKYMGNQLVEQLTEAIANAQGIQGYKERPKSQNNLSR